MELYAYLSSAFKGDIQAYLLREQVTIIHGDPYLWILISHLQRWSMVDYVLLLKNSSRYNIVLVEFKLLLGLTSYYRAPTVVPY